MATLINWPVGLPQTPTTDYSESGGVLMLVSPMDGGPAKMRKRGVKPTQLSLVFNMTTAQVATFKTFVENTIYGTYRFNFVHPRTGSSVEVRILPQDSGVLYNLSYLSPGRYKVQLAMEIMP